MWRGQSLRGLQFSLEVLGIKLYLIQGCDTYLRSLLTSFGKTAELVGSHGGGPGVGEPGSDGHWGRFQSPGGRYTGQRRRGPGPFRGPTKKWDVALPTTPIGCLRWREVLNSVVVEVV